MVIRSHEGFVSVLITSPPVISNFRFYKTFIFQLKSSINAPEARSNCGLAARSEGGKVALYVFGGLNCEQGWLSSVWKGIVEADKSRSRPEK